MARSSSAKNGKNSKNTYRASGSKSSKSSSSGTRHNSSASGSKKRMSRLEQRRAQQQNLIRSVVLAGFGILAIALVLVPGQSFWNVLRSWLFGTFGVVTYFVGPFLLYLAYLLASGYHVGTFIGKVLLLAVLLAGTAVIFSDFKVGDTPGRPSRCCLPGGSASSGPAVCLVCPSVHRCWPSVAVPVPISS